MNKTIRIGLLAAILAAQLLTLIGGFIAYEHLSETIWRLKWDYKQLYEETHDLIIDYGPEPNPFAPLLPVILSSLLLTVALVVDQICERSVGSLDPSERARILRSIPA